MATSTRPDRTEAAAYYFTYIDQVGAGDICDVLEEQSTETLHRLRDISEIQSLRRYAPDKWSMRELLSHMSDTERAFVFRALWFARGFESPLPSFDQNIAVPGAYADARSWSSHIEEFRAVRSGTLAFFQNLSADSWARRGIAGGNQFTVRALAYITAGHVEHHVRVLRERYLQRRAGVLAFVAAASAWIDRSVDQVAFLSWLGSTGYVRWMLASVRISAHADEFRGPSASRR